MKFIKTIPVFILIFLLVACDEKEKIYPTFTGKVTDTNCEDSYTSTYSSTIELNGSHQFDIEYGQCENLLNGVEIRIQYNKYFQIKKLELVNESTQ